jgi:hypothetical protein
MSFHGDASEYVVGRRNGVLSSEADLRSTFRDVDTAEDPVDVIDAALEDLLDEWRSQKDSKKASERDEFEGTLAVTLYETLKDLPAEVLTDRDFWRYMSVRMYEFIQWRDGETCSLESFGATGSALNWNCVPLRMFNRAHVAEVGRLAAGSDQEFYGVDLPGATDLWRSHILRVLTSYSPFVVHEMLKDYGNWTDRAKTLGMQRKDAVREYAKDLRRARSNLLFEVLDDESVADLLQTQTARTMDRLRSTSL